MYRISIVLILLFFSCKNNIKDKEQSQGIAKSKVEQIDQTEEKFHVFFKKFSNDSIFQKERIKDIIHLHNLYDTDKMEVVKYKKNDISFMDFRDDSIAYKKEYDKYRVETAIKQDSTTYSMYGIDNGINQHFVFKKENENKWYLIAIHDYSN